MVSTGQTARRVVRSDPVKPNATSLSWATSARSLPFERSILSSTLGKNSSINIRRTTPPEATPDRAATYLATV